MLKALMAAGLAASVMTAATSAGAAVTFGVAAIYNEALADMSWVPDDFNYADNHGEKLGYADTYTLADLADTQSLDLDLVSGNELLATTSGVYNAAMDFESALAGTFAYDAEVTVEHFAASTYSAINRYHYLVYAFTVDRAFTLDVQYINGGVGLTPIGQGPQQYVAGTGSFSKTLGPGEYWLYLGGTSARDHLVENRNVGAWNLDVSRSLSFQITESVVPEPATWALMILGFGAAGAGLRLRRDQAVTNA